MHRLLPACALAAIIAAGVAAAPALAAPAQGLSAVPVEQARAASIVDQAHCCWRYRWHRHWHRRWHHRWWRYY
jgi:hypothetical protein